MRRHARRWVLVTPLLATVVGCGGGAAPATPAPTIDPSASATPALGEAELAVCDGAARMSDGVTMIRTIRLRKGADGRLASALDLVGEGQRLVLDFAPARMYVRVRTLGFAVTNLTIAVEDLQTTDRLDAAVSNVKRRTTALRRAIDGFRAWVGCPGPTAEGADPEPSAAGAEGGAGAEGAAATPDG